jgi:hypothetical protein
MQAVWAHVAPRAALAPPSPEARRQLSCGAATGTDGKRRGTADRECLRVDAKGKVLDTQYRLVSSETSSEARKQHPRTEARKQPPRTRIVRRAPAPVAQSWGWSQSWGSWGGWGRGSWNGSW